MWRCGVSAGFWHARSCGDGDDGSATWAEGTPAGTVGLQELPGPIFLVIPLNPSFSPHWDLEEMGKHLTAAALPPSPLPCFLGSLWGLGGLGLVQALWAPFMLQKLGSSDATSCASREPQDFLFLFIVKRNAPRQARSSAVPWPYCACPQPLPSWHLSLPKASGCLSGSFLHGWSRSLVLPWKFSRLILFSAASRAPRVPETDGDGPIRGLFSCGRAKRKFWSGGWQQVAEARCPGRSSSGCPSPPGHPQVEAAGDVFHAHPPACVV